VAKFKKILHQVTIDEYLESQEELFPEGPPPPARPPYTAPFKVRGVPVFPGAIDAAGAVPAPPAPAQVVYSRYRKRE